MNTLFVSVEGECTAKRLPTFVTVHSGFSTMFLFMLVQIVLSGEPLATNITIIFLPMVFYALMLFELTQLREATPTLLTFVGHVCCLTEMRHRKEMRTNKSLRKISGHITDYGFYIIDLLKKARRD